MPRGKYDVIIFGATSFVGGILTRYIAAQYGWNKDLKWAIAGRSERKLQQVRGTLAPILGEDAGDVEYINRKNPKISQQAKKMKTKIS